MTSVNHQVQFKTESNSTVTVDDEVDDEPDLFDIVKLAAYRIFQMVTWPYVLAWEIFSSIVYVFFVPLKITKLFLQAIVVTLQISAQTTQSIADGSAFENNHLPNVNLVGWYKNMKQRGFFKKIKEYLANSETLKRWVNEIHQWAAKADSKPQAAANGEAKRNTTPNAGENDFED